MDTKSIGYVWMWNSRRKTIEYPPNELSQVSLEPPKQQKENEKLNEIHNSLEVFIKLFGKQNIGIAGKTTPKITVVRNY